MVTMLSHLVHTNSVIFINVTCDCFEKMTLYLIIKFEMLINQPKIMTSPSECKR